MEDKCEVDADCKRVGLSITRAGAAFRVTVNGMIGPMYRALRPSRIVSRGSLEHVAVSWR